MNALGSQQPFIPGTTQVNLGYTPGWSGSMSTSATGSLGVNFGYSFGPISGSVPLLTDTMTTGASALDLSGGLNSGSSVTSSMSTPGLAIGGGLSASMQAFCPFCVTVASASVSYHVGSQVTQNLGVNPNVTYGDLVWYSNGSNTTSVVNIVGGGGSVTNTFMAPSLATLGLPSGGGTFDMNILPYAALSLGVANEAVVSIPASVGYSYNVLGATGGGSVSGNLYALSTGVQDFTAAGTWYAPDVYSVELQAACTTDSFAVDCSYGTISANDPLLLLGSGGIPIDVPLSKGPVGPLSGGGGSSDFPNLGPLVPGDTGCVPGTVCNLSCPPNSAGVPQCITTVTITRVPEPSTFSLLAAALIGIALARPSRRKQMCVAIAARRRTCDT
ncbi:MAG: PEP-CTERM sorting domain-containing protein, partial [Casimicrobiaceae bacterium]